MIIIEHRFIIINMSITRDFNYSGLIESLVDGHTFCITLLEPLAFNYDYGFFGQNRTFPDVNKLECLIIESFWAPRTF